IFANNQPITFTGTGKIAGNSTIQVNDTAGVYFNGQLTDAPSGPGQLIVTGAVANSVLFLTNSSANNNYSGGTFLNSAKVRLVLGDSNALGNNGSSNPLGIQAGTVVAPTTGLLLNQTVFLNGAATFTGSQNITFSGPATLLANTTLTISNPSTTFSAA